MISKVWATVKKRKRWVYKEVLAEKINTHNTKKNPGWGLQQRDWRLLAHQGAPLAASSQSADCHSQTHWMFFFLCVPSPTCPPPPKELEAVGIWNASQVLHCLACALCERQKRQKKQTLCWSWCFWAGVSFFLLLWFVRDWLRVFRKGVVNVRVWPDKENK